LIFERHQRGNISFQRKFKAPRERCKISKIT
jgi:hypothetical protein